MYPSASYYACIGDGNGRHIVLIQYMDLIDFFKEFLKRFGRPPFIVSLTAINEDEFDQLEEAFESDESIFIGEYRGDDE